MKSENFNPSRTERACCTLRSCITSVSDKLERQSVMFKGERSLVQERLILTGKVCGLATMPMELVHFGKSLPVLRFAHLHRRYRTCKAFLYCRNVDTVDNDIILSVCFKDSVCSPIAHHKLLMLFDDIIQLINDSCRKQCKNLVVNSLYHITVVWIKHNTGLCCRIWYIISHIEISIFNNIKVKKQ